MEFRLISQEGQPPPHTPRQPHPPTPANLVASFAHWEILEKQLAGPQSGSLPPVSPALSSQQPRVTAAAGPSPFGSRGLGEGSGFMVQG